MYHLMLNDTPNVITELAPKGPRFVEIIEGEPIPLVSTILCEIAKTKVGTLDTLIRRKSIALRVSKPLGTKKFNEPPSRKTVFLLNYLRGSNILTRIQLIREVS